MTAQKRGRGRPRKVAGSQLNESQQEKLSDEILNHPWLPRVFASIGGACRSYTKVELSRIVEWQWRVKSFSSDLEEIVRRVSLLDPPTVDAVYIDELEQTLKKLERSIDTLFVCTRHESIHRHVLSERPPTGSSKNVAEDDPCRE